MLTLIQVVHIFQTLNVILKLKIRSPHFPHQEIVEIEIDLMGGSSEGRCCR